MSRNDGGIDGFLGTLQSRHARVSLLLSPGDTLPAVTGTVSTARCTGTGCGGTGWCQGGVVWDMYTLSRLRLDYVSAILLLVL